MNNSVNFICCHTRANDPCSSIQNLPCYLILTDVLNSHTNKKTRWTSVVTIPVMVTYCTILYKQKKSQNMQKSWFFRKCFNIMTRWKLSSIAISQEKISHILYSFAVHYLALKWDINEVSIPPTWSQPHGSAFFTQFFIA